MSRVGYDAVTVSAMPHDGAIYGGYVDGHWPTFASLKDRYPGKRYVSITVNGSRDALCADIELGDFTVDGGVRWAKDKVKRAGLAWLYCNVSTWPAVQTAVRHAGISANVRYWIAHYDRVAVIPQGAIGKQYLGDFNGYDKSIFADHIAGLDPVQLEPGWYVRQLQFPIPPMAGPVKRVNLTGKGVVPVQFGRDVMVVQRKVGATVDGMYGPGTRAKVGDYQEAHGLSRDGIVGPHTAVRLGP